MLNQVIKELDAYDQNPASQELLESLMKKENFTVLFEFDRLTTLKYFGTLKSIFKIDNLLYVNSLNTIKPEVVDAVFIMIPHPRELREKIVRFAREHRKPIFVLEAGFVSSIFTMQESEPPISYNVDFLGGTYLMRNRVSSFSAFLESETELTSEELENAKELANVLRESGLSKYNTASGRSGEEIVKGSSLIIDQSYNDWSITASGASVETFDKMVEDALIESGDKIVYIKVHPDTLAGKRKGNITISRFESHKSVRILTSNLSPKELFSNIGSVYSVCSTLGFEALIHGKKVYSYGASFYSGWGLTVDRHNFQKRKRERSLVDLIHVSYLRFTYYMSPCDRLPVDGLSAIYEFRELVERYRQSWQVTNYLSGLVNERVSLLEEKLSRLERLPRVAPSKVSNSLGRRVYRRMKNIVKKILK